MCDREHIIQEFMKSKEDFVCINWHKLGYNSVASARTSFINFLSCKLYNCYVMSRGNDVYLVKNGYSVPTDCLNPKTIITINRKQQLFMNRAKIEKFLESDLSIIEVPWIDLDYVTCGSCYESIKNTIRRYEYDSEIGIFRQKSRVFLFKYPKKDDFEQIISISRRG